MQVGLIFPPFSIKIGGREMKNFGIANCTICGKEFEKKVYHAITCSKECSKERDRRGKEQSRKEKAEQRKVDKEKQLKETMKELGGKWREVSTIEGYEQYTGYWVSDQGKVMGKSGKVLTEQYLVDREYKMVEVRINGTPKQLDQLVAHAFVEGWSKEKCYVDHIDREPTNNKASNLRWVTMKENCANKDNSANAKKSGATRKENKERYQKGDLPNEVWKDVGELIIEGEQKYISGKYFISNKGRLKDEEQKTITYGRERKRDSNGDSECKTYYSVDLKRKDGSRIKNQLMHRLVALAFVEGWSKERNDIDHIKGNSNEASNLRWVTKAENTREAYKTGECKAGEKTSIPIVQLTLEGEFVREYKNVSEAGKDGYNNHHITDCLKGRNNSHGGYRFIYKEDWEKGNWQPLTEHQIKIAKANTGKTGRGGITTSTRNIANAKFQTQAFKIAVEKRKSGEWSVKTCAEYAGYKSIPAFNRAIKKAIKAGILSDKYENIVW